MRGENETYRGLMAKIQHSVNRSVGDEDPKVPLCEELQLLNVESFVLLFLFTNGISYYVCFWNKKFEETKGVIRIHKSKDRQHNGQTKKVKCTNNDLQNTTQKTRNTNSTI
jgi:hypothetical protein